MRIFSYLVTIAFLFSIQAPAQDAPTENPPPVNESVPAVAEPAVALSPISGELPTKVYRPLSRGTVMGHLSPLSTWLSMKYGFNAGYVANENWTWEFEYTHSSLSLPILGIDVGKIEDERYGVQSRWYPGTNSFHLIMGFFKSKISAELGNTILSHMASTPSVTMWKFESMGPQVGIGNRWQWGNGLTLGMDWFLMYLPLVNKRIDDDAFRNVSNQKDREDLDKVSQAIVNLPQFDLLRFSIGYTF